MSHRGPKPKAYLKEGCPFSFKYLLFMEEAGLLDQIEVIRCHPRDRRYDEIKSRIEAATGEEASFPTVELEPGVFTSDSDQLIRRFAESNAIDPDGLPVFAFYRDTLFPAILEMQRTSKRSPA